MIDVSFVVSLLIVFVGAMIGSYLRSAVKDRCLKDFDSYHVTLEKANGQIIWGNLRLQTTGMELEYRVDVQDTAHIETSYVFYKSEYKDLRGIYRYADDLTPEKRKQRERDLRRSFHPGPIQILNRHIRNFFSRATDSLAEAMPLLTGQAKKPASRYISAAEETYLQKLGKNIIGYVGTNYDPLLEEYVGAKVVVEMVEGDDVYEYVGVLKEYSGEFLEILDVFYPQVESICLSGGPNPEAIEKNIRIAYLDGVFQIQNRSGYPLLLQTIRYGDKQGDINAVIGPGDELRVQKLALTAARNLDRHELSVFFEGLSKAEEDSREKSDNSASVDLETLLAGISTEAVQKEGIQFDFKVIRLLDMIVPRERALIRHKAERYDPNELFGRVQKGWFSFGKTDLEASYRAALRRNPRDVVSAAGLSQLLLEKGEFAEAAKWLEMTLQHRDQLVDGGRIADMQLRMVRARLERAEGAADKIAR